MNNKKFLKFLIILSIQLAIYSSANGLDELKKSNEVKANLTSSLFKSDLPKSESIQHTIKKVPSNQLNVNELKQFDNQAKIKVSSSNYGIRVIKAPSLQTLKLDGQRLKELNSKLSNKLKVGDKLKNEELNKNEMKSNKLPQITSTSNSDKKEVVNKENRFYAKSQLPIHNTDLGSRIKQNLIKQNLPNKGYLPKKYLNYQYDHHIDHTNNIYQNSDHFNLYPEVNNGFSDQKSYHDLINHKIEKTKDNMKKNLNLIHHHHRIKPTNLDQINMEPLKIHLNPYLKGLHHRPNKFWGDHESRKYPVNKLNQSNYNRKQSPSASQIKKQVNYRKNPYPHLKRFKYLANFNQGKTHHNAKLNNLDYHLVKKEKDNSHLTDDFDKDFNDDKEFEKERKYPNFNVEFASLDRLPSIDFRTLAPVFVKNIDYDSFYKLNPYFTIPLPQYTK